MYNCAPFVILSMLLCSTLSFAASPTTHKVMYRYTDEQGKTTISNILPPEATNQGYTILNARGQVKEEVPPKASEAQIRQQAEQQAKQEEQIKADKALLQTFSNAAEIQQAKKTQITALEAQEQITTNVIKRMMVELANLTKKASFYESRGQNVPTNIQQAIQASKKQIMENKDFLERKQIEKKQIAQQYDQLFARFNILKTQYKVNTSAY